MSAPDPAQNAETGAHDPICEAWQKTAGRPCTCGALSAETVRQAPSGSEAQCPICDRIFGSDSTCEKHKPYAKPKTDTCKNPADLGMEIRWRRGGVAVWVRPMPSDAANLRGAGNGKTPERGGLGPERVPAPLGFDGSSDD